MTQACELVTNPNARKDADRLAAIRHDGPLNYTQNRRSLAPRPVQSFMTRADTRTDHPPTPAHTTHHTTLPLPDALPIGPYA